MNNVPSWYELLLLAFAAWRTYRLIAEDTILDRPRRWALNLGPDWKQEGDDVPDNYRAEWGLFITCPYCAGFWISLTWWVAWVLWPHATLLVAGFLGITTLLIFLAKLDEKANE